MKISGRQEARSRFAFLGSAGGTYEKRFFKGHGLGNDYIAVDPAELDFKLTPGNIRKICDRNWGVGSDGILALSDSKKADFGLRIYNPDGSEAEKSGNRLRIFARYLHATRRVRKKSFTVDTKGGLVRIRRTSTSWVKRAQLR